MSAHNSPSNPTPDSTRVRFLHPNNSHFDNPHPDDRLPTVIHIDRRETIPDHDKIGIMKDLSQFMKTENPEPGKIHD